MTLNQLTDEYQDWLAVNDDVPKLGADEALYHLIEPEPEKRTAKAKRQIDWLIDFIQRWEKVA
jgi:hypothetical protein